jgi:hypothetical protein
VQTETDGGCCDNALTRSQGAYDVLPFHFLESSPTAAFRGLLSQFIMKGIFSSLLRKKDTLRNLTGSSSPLLFPTQAKLHLFLPNAQMGVGATLVSGEGQIRTEIGRSRMST